MIVLLAHQQLLMPHGPFFAITLQKGVIWRVAEVWAPMTQSSDISYRVFILDGGLCWLSGAEYVIEFLRLRGSYCVNILLYLPN
jgi:hypothetical protein